MSLSPRVRIVSGGIAVVALGVLVVASVVVLRDHGGSSGVAVGPSTTVASSSDTPPPLRNTGTDWDQIVRSIVAYQAWLFGHPQPDLVANIFLPTYEHYEDQRTGLTNLAKKGWHYDPQFHPATVEMVRLEQRTGADSVVVFVRTLDPPNRIVDGAGQVVIDSPGAGESSVLWTLRLVPTSSAQWRVAEVTTLTGQTVPS